MWILIFQRLFLEALWNLVYFPLWWYTGGLKYAGASCSALFKSGNDSLSPGLWLKNIFVPMYGQYDWQGRIISFFMRLAQIIFRGIALFIWLLVCLAVFFAWLALPVVCVYGLIFAIQP